MVLSSVMGCTIVCIGAATLQPESPVDFNEIGSMLQTRQGNDFDLAVTAVGNGPVPPGSPTWFNAQLAALQTEGDAIYADINACNMQTNPKEALVGAARDSHSKCREEEFGMAGMNLTKDCADSKKKDCDMMQSTFELATCTHSESQAAFFKAVAACHTAASHVVTKTGVMLKESNLKEEFIYRQQFKCRMSKWPLTQAEKQHCKDLQPDTSHLGVTYPSQPSPKPRAKLTQLPGDAAWLAKEYSSKNWSKLVKNAVGCVTTTTTTTTRTLTEIAFSVETSNFDTPGRSAKCLQDTTTQGAMGYQGGTRGTKGCNQGDWNSRANQWKGATVTFKLDAPRKVVRFVVYNEHNSDGARCVKDMKIEQSMSGVDSWVEVKSVTLDKYVLGVTTNQPQNLDVASAKASKFWRFKLVSNYGAKHYEQIKTCFDPTQFSW